MEAAGVRVVAHGESTMASVRNTAFNVLIGGIGWAAAAYIVNRDDGSGGLMLGGLILGLTQWAMWRRRVATSAWWVTAYALSWFMGLWFADPGGSFGPNPLTLGGVGGGTMAIVQWLVLRTKVRRAWAWIAATTFSSIVACWVGVIAGVQAYGHVGRSAAWVTGGLVAGIVIAALLSMFSLRLVPNHLEKHRVL